MSNFNNRLTRRFKAICGLVIGFVTVLAIGFGVGTFVTEQRLSELERARSYITSIGFGELADRVESVHDGYWFGRNGTALDMYTPTVIVKVADNGGWDVKWMVRSTFIDVSSADDLACKAQRLKEQLASFAPDENWDAKTTAFLRGDIARQVSDTAHLTADIDERGLDCSYLD